MLFSRLYNSAFKSAENSALSTSVSQSTLDISNYRTTSLAKPVELPQKLYSGANLDCTSFNTRLPQFRLQDGTDSINGEQDASKKANDLSTPTTNIKPDNGLSSAQLLLSLVQSATNYRNQQSKHIVQESTQQATQRTTSEDSDNHPLTASDSKRRICHLSPLDLSGALPDMKRQKMEMEEIKNIRERLESDTFIDVEGDIKSEPQTPVRPAFSLDSTINQRILSNGELSEKTEDTVIKDEKDLEKLGLPSSPQDSECNEAAVSDDLDDVFTMNSVPSSSVSPSSKSTLPDDIRSWSVSQVYSFIKSMDIFADYADVSNCYKNCFYLVEELPHVK